jgi:modulator of FtsH protease HflK
MPWNDQNGGGRPNGGGRGPSGNGPSGGGLWPPDLKHILKRSRKTLRPFLRRGLAQGSAVTAGLVVAAVWLMSGLYIVSPDEQGVVLRFGALAGRTAPGIHYRLPWPIESVDAVKITRENQLNIGYRTVDLGHALELPEESRSLTGDENIVDIDFTVFWVIKDAAAFLFNVDNRGQDSFTIKAVAESTMREVIGRNRIEPILTVSREPIQIEVRALMQAVLDSYGAGVTVTRVQMQKADPPTQVLDSYRDVQAARTDQDRMRNEAEAYANKVVPEARGGAARILQQADGYKQQVTAEAQGEAQRFLSVEEQYKKAPDVTRERIYIDTMQGIFAGMNKVIIDSKSGSDVVPYLVLPPLRQGVPRAVPPGSIPPVALPPVADAGRGRP